MAEVSPAMHALGSTRSCIRELFEYGRRKAAADGPQSVMDFSLGNPSIPAPQAVADALAGLLARETPVQLHSYTSAAGDDGARAAIAESLTRRFGGAITARDLFLIGGAAPALIAVFKALTPTPGSEILAIAPYFPEYPVFVRHSAGAVFGAVPADTDAFQIRLDALADMLTPETRAVIINSPNNPSGVVYTRATLTRLAALLGEKSAAYGHPIWIICDEPYRELAYGVDVPWIPDIYKNTIVCYSYSKSLSLPGERIGWIFVPPGAEDARTVYDAIAGAARAIGHVCAPSLMQKVAGLCCDVQPDLTIYDTNRRRLYDAMTAMGYRCARPDGAFYLFFEAPHGLTGQAFSDMAKERYGLLLVPGDDFGCPNHLRLSYCVPTERIEQALPFLEQLIREA
jgi:aspartate aminotransferase